MADNVSIDPGTTTPIAADDIGSVFYQRTKTTLGPNNTATADWAGRDLGNSEGGAAYVDLRQKVTVLTVTSAGLTTASTAYTAGDQLGTEITVASAVRQSGATATIVHAVLLDKANAIGPVDLFLFDRASTPAADNAANAWSDADMLNCLGIIEFAYPKPTANNRFAHAVNLPVMIMPNATSLFCDFVTRQGHTFFGAAGDLVAKLFVVQD